MSRPKVSVCIPCYNAEEYVDEAIASALNQSWGNIEVIAVDDGSVDATGEILDAYRSPSLTVVHQSNRGQCAAANRALELATGDYVKFFDADDIMHPRMIERQVARIEMSDVDVASAGWGRFCRSDKSSFRLNPETVWRDMDAREWLVESWQFARPMMQCALWLIPRRILDCVGGWDEELSLINDFEFFARVLTHAEGVRFTDGVPLMYRSGLEGSLSGQKSDSAIESAFRSLMRGTGHLLAVRDDRESRRACANLLQDFIYTYYPRRADLLEQVVNRVAELEGSDLAPSGSTKFHALRKIVGWKLASRVRQLAGRRR